eukprot:365662-Chlamydomonas_euryale.AAC.2
MTVTPASTEAPRVCHNEVGAVRGDRVKAQLPQLGLQQQALALQRCAQAAARGWGCEVWVGWGRVGAAVGECKESQQRALALQRRAQAAARVCCCEVWMRWEGCGGGGGCGSAQQRTLALQRCA